MPANLENSAVATGQEKSVFIPVPSKGNAKECSNCRTTALISQASKVMLKILQARLQWYINHELPDVQAGFRKGRGTRDQIANIQASPCGSDGKESACNEGDLGSIPGFEIYPGEGKGYPLQYSGLENSMDCIVQGLSKSWT